MVFTYYGDVLRTVGTCIIHFTSGILNFELLDYAHCLDKTRANDFNYRIEVFNINNIFTISVIDLYTMVLVVELCILLYYYCSRLISTSQLKIPN